ncbi:MAG: aspartate--tRNA ligase [bacterium]
MRSHFCGLVDETLVDQRVELCGWADTRRDHGGVIFIDLRDHKGIVQVVIEPDQAAAFANAHDVRYEFCLRVVGKVHMRPDGQHNDRLHSGKIEVIVDECEVLNAAKPLPFQLDEEAGEEIRLRYRYLDLRRAKMQDTLRMRSKVTSAIRSYVEDLGFIDIETPILTRATPEGARDYLVPSRVHDGEFYALPQSPQLFKQMLMMSGMDRYYQIARCFRDEDLRADRQPEFTQLDMEMAFVEQKDVQNMAEGLVKHVFKQVLDVDLGDFPVMTYHEAMTLYGSDKPDLRNPLQLVDIADAVKDVDFKVFSIPANESHGRVVALKVPGAAQKLTRKQIDDYAPFVARYGAKGLAWIKVNDKAAGREGLQSPIVKFLHDDALKGILEMTRAENGDILFFGAGNWHTVSDYMGQLRLKVGVDLELTTEGWKPLWVNDFPMFEWDDKQQRWFAMHHPFTSPKVDTVKALVENTHEQNAKAYDMVVNGVELGGGSIRIHRQEIQQAVFDLLGISSEEAESKFGFLLEALQYGCPPHGGIAFGLDRMCALFAGVNSIRDVIPFPKTATASCLLTSAPSEVSGDQLKELHIKVAEKPKIAE